MFSKQKEFFVGFALFIVALLGAAWLANNVNPSVAFIFFMLMVVLIYFKTKE